MGGAKEYGGISVHLCGYMVTVVTVTVSVLSEVHLRVTGNKCLSNYRVPIRKRWCAFTQTTVRLYNDGAPLRKQLCAYTQIESPKFTQINLVFYSLIRTFTFG